MKTNGIFIGKEIAKQGKKKDGTDYTLYKLKFKPSEESDKSFSMSTFDSKIALKELQWYNIEYSEKDGVSPQGAPIKHKTLISATEGKGEVTAQSQPKQDQSLRIVEWDTFVKMYKESDWSSVGVVPSAGHMIGLYVATYYPELVKDIKAKCLEAFAALKNYIIIIDSEYPLHRFA
jgi:hypothetical protein